jgi:hypothetical protein
MEERWIRLDLLAHLLNVPVTEANRIVDVCIGLGLVEDERILVKERYAWVWPTGVGAQATGIGLPCIGRPKLHSLAHAEAVAWTRIFFTGEEEVPYPFFWRLRSLLRSMAGMLAKGLGRRCGFALVPKLAITPISEHGLGWVAGRYAFREQANARRGYVPDALLVNRDARHALLIGFGSRPVAKMVEILTDLSRSVDTMSCFCSQREAPRVQEAIEESGLSKVYIRPTLKPPTAISPGAYLLSHVPQWIREGLRRLGFDLPLPVVTVGTTKRGKTFTVSRLAAELRDKGQQLFFLDGRSTEDSVKLFLKHIRRHPVGLESLGLLDRLWLRLCLVAEVMVERAVCATVAIQEKVSGYVESRLVASGLVPLAPPSVRFDLVHLEALCILAEEEFVRADLLARLLGVPLSRAREVLDVCMELGLAKQAMVFVHDNNPWASSTAKGLLVVESTKKQPSEPVNLHEFGCLEARATVHAFLTEAPRQTRLGALGRSIAAQAVAWLADRAGYSLVWKPAPGVLQSDGARWVYGSDSVAEHSRDAGSQLADVFLDVNGKRTAILIEPFNKRPQLTAEAFRELGRAAGVVCCYCSPWARREITRVIERYGLVNVLVADIPELSSRK